MAPFDVSAIDRAPTFWVVTFGLFLCYSMTLLLPRNVLAEMTEPNKELLERHLHAIVGERFPGLSDEHLAEAFTYVKQTLSSLAYEIELHDFQVEGSKFQNIIARKPGLDRNKRIIVGAHFDSVAGTPGADDNASGVAAMLELARILKDHSWKHTIEFVGFHMEEWNMLGSSAYVRKLKRENVNVRGMISLEMVGFTSDAPGSQNMPPGFGAFYPDVGNFIGLVGNVRSWNLLKSFKRNMKKIDALPVESLVIPFNGLLLPPTRWSDQSPFWDAGYPALMITDTSFYRNPNYHGPGDTLETLDRDFMVKVTRGVAKALVELDRS